MQIEYLAVLISAYLIGSISFAYIVARVAGGVDIRKAGSGNAGARNVARCLGAKYGFLTGFLDVLKGALPMALLTSPAREYSGSLALAAACMLVAGHNWPVFLGFKGGNGLAVSVGVMLSLVFRIAFFLLVFTLFTGWLSTKIKPVAEFASPVDIEAIVGYILFPLVLMVYGAEPWIVVMPLILGVIMLPTRISHIKKAENESKNTVPARNTE